MVFKLLNHQNKSLIFFLSNDYHKNLRSPHNGKITQQKREAETSLLNI